MNNKKIFFVKHPGNTFGNMFCTNIENRKEISCYIDINRVNNEDNIYVMGGFNGGRQKSYLNMCEILKNNTIKDDNNNLIPIWHDESQMNWYKTTLNKNDYTIFNLLYSCPQSYNKNTYIDIKKKNHSEVRVNDNIKLNFTNNFNTDLLRILYLIDKYKKDITLPILNTTYGISSRQGILKNFFRIDDNSEGIKNEKNKYNTDNHSLVLSNDSIKNLINKLNINFNSDNFFEKYKNFHILHISKNFEKYRYCVYKYCKNNRDINFLLVFHEKKYFYDIIWKNLENIETYKFKDDEEKIILLSYIDYHIFYNINDVFIILMINKFFHKNKSKLIWIYSLKNHNSEHLSFIKDNFIIKLINYDLKPGFSFIIRAKNELLNVNNCLKSLEPILTLLPSSEIIFVDNNSSDDTFKKANDILSKYDNALILKYNIEVPRAGEEHKNITKNNPELSLGTYYRWCYSFSSRYIVIKWDCDFYCNIQNLIQMINYYKLCNNSEDISVWFSGQQTFIKDKKYYIDEESYYLYNEPRIQSKLNGFRYEDSKDNMWETPYTEYLLKNENNNKSYHYGFPTSYFLVRYLESKNINDLFEGKNIYDYFKYIYESSNKSLIINELKKNVLLYKNVEHLLNDKEKIIFYEMKHTDLLNKNNNLRDIDERDKKIKNILLSFDETISNNNNNYLKNKNIMHKPKICFLVLVCDRYKKRLEKVMKYLLDFPYDFFLIKANSNLKETILENNILTVNCEECYENLPKKIILAFKYLYKNTNYDYFLKIDDDIRINVENLHKFINKNFFNLDYLGAFAGGHVQLDWHFGKCKNDKLNKKLYWNGYNGDWCGGGFGYILSRYAVFLLLKKDNFEYIYNEIYEDKSIGDILRKEGIYPCFEFLPDLKISKKIGMIGDDYLFICNH
jgi:hypothetical protein